MSSTCDEFDNPTPDRSVITDSASIAATALFTKRFLDEDIELSRRIYLRIVVQGTFMVIIVIFAVLSIYWGSLWKVPSGKLEGWVVDFDGGIVGQAVTQGLTRVSNLPIAWKAVSASAFGGQPSRLAEQVLGQQTWAAVAVNAGTSNRLEAAYQTPDAAYNGTEAITVFTDEARNENAYRLLIRPSTLVTLDFIVRDFALNASKILVNSSNVTSILATSPQTIITPIYYSFENLAPFNIPVASAVTFVGLIYQLILGFFIVAIGFSAREVSGFNRLLTFKSLLIVRYVTFFCAMFIVSLFYALLSLAFHVDFTRKFGHVGFFLFWMLNWVGMLAVGLALEALITLLTPVYTPHFMIFWIIVNVSISFYPLEILPSIFRYGYAAPFYNVSHAVRCIVFGTKNNLGLNFGVLIAWTGVSVVTLALMQWFVRRRDIARLQKSSTAPGQLSRHNKREA